MPVSVFRRYTPPTCTLELRGERSPLSAWSGRPILKQVQFMLSIDGPQRSQEQKVTLKGGRTQLASLHSVIDAYVQHTLGLSTQQFQTTLLNPSPAQSSSTAVEEAITSERKTSAGQASMGQAMAMPSRIHDMGWARLSSQDISMTPKGLLKHELHLGKLAPHPSVASVVLNTTELFDLAHALDTYHGEVDSIPELNPSQQQGVQPWMKGAAVAVLAIGVTASVANVLQFPGFNAPFNVAKQETATEGAIASLDGSADQDLAPQTESAALPNLELDAIPSADEALREESEESEDTDAVADEAGEGAADADDRLDRESTEIQPKSSADKPATDDTANDANQVDLGAIARVPSIPGSSPTDTPRQPSRQSPQGNASRPNQPSRSTTAPSPTAPAAIAPSPLPAEIAAAGSRPAPSTPPPGRANEGRGETEDFASVPPELTSIPPIPSVASGIDPLADSIEQNSQTTLDSNVSAPASETSPAAANSARAAQPEATEPQGHSGSAENQRMEVQSYFESVWQPPETLNQSLQYRLEFNGDGSLRQAIPLGESARSYRSNVDVPAVGAPFVSPFSGNDTPPMRLFLGANGEVRVFIESLD